jgi:hypothetical protein
LKQTATAAIPSRTGITHLENVGLRYKAQRDRDRRRQDDPDIRRRSGRVSELGGSGRLWR